MAEIVADEGGEVLRDMAEEILEDTFLRAAEGDDFIGVQAYTRMHFGPDGVAPDDPSVRPDADGQRILAPGRGPLRAAYGGGDRPAHA